MRLRDMPTGAEYLDATGARARVDALLLATNGVDLDRVVPAILPDLDTPRAMMTLLQAGFTFDILEVTES
jgi:hypothetical protein